jgi:hypothetical protein
MPAPFPDSQNTTFSFAGTEYELTDLSESTEGGSDPTEQRIDVSTLSLASGADRVYQDPPLIDRGPAGATGTQTISISFLGSTPPPVNTEATLVVSSLGISQNATCTASTRDLAVGEVIKGTAEFTLSTP